MEESPSSGLKGMRVRLCQAMAEKIKMINERVVWALERLEQHDLSSSSISIHGHAFGEAAIEPGRSGLLKAQLFRTILEARVWSG